MGFLKLTSLEIENCNKIWKKKKPNMTLSVVDIFARFCIVFADVLLFLNSLHLMRGTHMVDQV